MDVEEKHFAECQKLYQECCILLQNQEYDKCEKVLKQLYVAEEPFEHFKHQFSAGLYIDLGDDTKNQDLTNTGITLVDELIEDMQYKPDDDYKEQMFVTYYYNLANGYSSLYVMKVTADKDYGLYNINSTEIVKAIKYYRLAQKHITENTEQEQIAKIYVNLGNCYHRIGRVLDALEVYQKGFTIMPRYIYLRSAVAEIIYVYSIRIQHFINIQQFINYSYRLFAQINQDKIEDGFYLNYLKDMIKRIYPYADLENELPLPPIDLDSISDSKEKKLTKFILKHDLYLNFYNSFWESPKAIGDMVNLRGMTLSLAEESVDCSQSKFYKVAAFMNQIKETFIASRFLLFISMNEDIDLSYVDKESKKINTLDYTENTVKIEFLKIAFSNFYNILDKIASALNVYLDLGIPEDKIDFKRTLWAEVKKGKSEIHSQIKKINNSNLNALFYLARSLTKDGEYDYLFKTRNKSTHNLLKVVWFPDGSEQEVSEEELRTRTIEMAYMVKNAYIYAICFIQDMEEEKKKDLGEDEFIPSINFVLEEDQIQRDITC